MGASSFQPEAVLATFNRFKNIHNTWKINTSSTFNAYIACGCACLHEANMLKAQSELREMMLIHDHLVGHTLEVAAERSVAWHAYEDKIFLYNETLKRYHRVQKDYQTLKGRNQYNIRRQQMYITKVLQPCKSQAIRKQPVRQLAAFTAAFGLEFVLSRETQQVSQLKEKLKAIRGEIRTARTALVEAGNHLMNVRCYANSIKTTIKRTTECINDLGVFLAEEENRERAAWRDTRALATSEAAEAQDQRGHLSCAYCDRQKWQEPRLPIASIGLDLE